MRIGIDISQVAFTGTGIATYTQNLVRELLRIDTTNDYVLFGSSLRRKDILIQYVDTLTKRKGLDARFFSLPPSVLEGMWNGWHTGDIELLTGNINVFHTSDWLEPPSKSKKVTTIHDLLVYKFEDSMHPKIVANQKKKLEWVQKESQLILVDSESTKQDCIDILGIEADKLRVVYLGVDSRFKPVSYEERERVKKKYNIKSDYILTMGTLEPRKNIKRVIEASKKLLSKDLQLVVVGKYVWGEALDIPENVQIIEFIETEEVPALYGGALCFAYPSLYEGFGLPVLEAMACGCPVVTSDRGSLKEVAGPSTIVHPEDVDAISKAIRKVIDSTDSQYEAQVKKGFDWVKKFTWEKTAKETLKVYKEAAL